MKYEAHPVLFEVHVGAVKKMIVMYSTKLVQLVGVPSVMSGM